MSTGVVKKILFGLDQKQAKDVTLLSQARSWQDLMWVPVHHRERQIQWQGPRYTPEQKTTLWLIDEKEVVVTELSQIHSETYVNIKTGAIRPKESLSAEEKAPFDAMRKLQQLQPRLERMIGGYSAELYPLHIMSALLIQTGEEVILELGAGVGRNTLFLASLLKHEEKQLVSMECNHKYSRLLQQNKRMYQKKFHTESSALSKQPLVQRRDKTESLVQHRMIPGSRRITHMSWTDLQNKYKAMKFDTLIVDCEGAFAQILADFPTILADIKKVCIRNDFTDQKDLDAVQQAFKQQGFQCTLTKPLLNATAVKPAPWMSSSAAVKPIDYPGASIFYQNWQR